MCDFEDFEKDGRECATCGTKNYVKQVRVTNDGKFEFVNLCREHLMIIKDFCKLIPDLNIE